MKRITILVLLSLILLACSHPSSENSLDTQAVLPAFPGAEGGALAQGGRGGRVIYVTNLNDNGAGSLRAALEATGRRTVIYRTSR
jgi:hypothetical protein